MLATDQLKKEHKVIKLMLDVLEKICDRLEGGEKINSEHLDQILEFIRVFVDNCHHGKEEDLLFPAMEEAGVPKEGGPIGVMLMEHDEGRNYVKNMAQAIGEYKNRDEKAVKKILENARNYIWLLREHIHKGDNILFMIANMHLSEEEHKELLESFEKVEKEKIGIGKHEEFHEVVHQLSEIYLK